MGRLNRFLNAPEVQLDVDQLEEGSEDAVVITDATFYWVDPASGGVDRNLLSGEPLRDGKNAKGEEAKEEEAKEDGVAGAGASAGNDDDDDDENGAGRPRKVSVEELRESASVPALHDVSLSAKKGSLVAVVGPVGAGKTSFCHAILGELWKEKVRTHNDTPSLSRFPHTHAHAHRSLTPRTPRCWRHRDAWSCRGASRSRARRRGF